MMIVLMNHLSFAESEKAEDNVELFLQHINSKHLIKSGTSLIAYLLNNDSEHNYVFKTAFRASSRPYTQTFADSERGHFRVHYDTSGEDAPVLIDNDNNGIPDYVDSTMVYLEYAWDPVINKLGYTMPIFRWETGRQ